MKLVCPETFDLILATHGAAPDAWPADVREAALDLIAVDASARARWHAAIDLEARLDDWKVPEADADLALRIAAAAPLREGPADILARADLRWWQGAVCAALPILIGFLIAVAQTPALQASHDDAERAEKIELAHLSSLGLLPRQTLR